MKANNKNSYTCICELISVVEYYMIYDSSSKAVIGDMLLYHLIFALRKANARSYNYREVVLLFILLILKESDVNIKIF